MATPDPQSQITTIRALLSAMIGQGGTAAEAEQALRRMGFNAGDIAIARSAMSGPAPPTQGSTVYGGGTRDAPLFANMPRMELPPSLSRGPLPPPAKPFVPRLELPAPSAAERAATDKRAKMMQGAGAALPAPPPPKPVTQLAPGSARETQLGGPLPGEGRPMTQMLPQRRPTHLEVPLANLPLPAWAGGPGAPPPSPPMPPTPPGPWKGGRPPIPAAPPPRVPGGPAPPPFWDAPPAPGGRGAPAAPLTLAEKSLQGFNDALRLAGRGLGKLGDSMEQTRKNTVGLMQALPGIAGVAAGIAGMAYAANPQAANTLTQSVELMAAQTWGKPAAAAANTLAGTYQDIGGKSGGLFDQITKVANTYGKNWMETPTWSKATGGVSAISALLSTGYDLTLGEGEKKPKPGLQAPPILPGVGGAQGAAMSFEQNALTFGLSTLNASPIQQAQMQEQLRNMSETGGGDLAKKLDELIENTRNLKSLTPAFR